MKQYNQREIIQILQDNGFNLVRQNKHQIWSDGIQQIIVPSHKIINFKVATKIINQCRNRIAT